MKIISGAPAPSHTLASAHKPAVNLAMELSEWLLLGLLSVIWGGSFFFVEVAVREVTPLTLVFCRVGLAHFLTREERLTGNRGIGVLLGWLGVVLLIGVESLEGLDLQIAGYLAVLGAAFCYACAAIFGRRFRGLSPVTVTTGMLCCSSVLLVPLVLIFEQPLALHPGAAAYGAILGLSLLSTAAAYMIYFRILARAGATNILLVTFLIPVSAIFLGVVFLGERLGWNALGGLLLIFAGLIAIDGRLLKRFASAGK